MHKAWAMLECVSYIVCGAGWLSGSISFHFGLQARMHIRLCTGWVVCGWRSSRSNETQLCDGRTESTGAMHYTKPFSLFVVLFVRCLPVYMYVCVCVCFVWIYIWITSGLCVVCVCIADPRPNSLFRAYPSVPHQSALLVSSTMRQSSINRCSFTNTTDGRTHTHTFIYISQFRAKCIH